MCVDSSIADGVRGGTNGSAVTFPAARAAFTVSLSMSERITPSVKLRPFSRAISSIISRHHWRCGAAPEPPAEPTTTGMPRRTPSTSMKARSLLTNALSVKDLPLPR